MIYTKFFKDLGKFDAPIAGGKGASLGEMTQAGIPVPGGYVVLSETFEKFIHATNLFEEIDSILDKVDHKAIHTIDQASEDIRALILSREMPDEIKTEIMESFAELNAEFVAVRSSATAEDGTDHAWAGQLESYLNVTHDDVLEKVQHCWSSLFTPRAIFYRFEKGLHTTKISVAVVVQKMVNSEKSGIAFSVHPVTEDRNQIIIEAGYGLGEAIVSGSVTPDSYVIEKEPRRIIDVSVNHQNRAMYRKGNNGNEWIDLDDAKASSQVLDEPEILELSTIIMRIENHYGFPCDIEWAYELGEFFIVQSRPITTLSNVDQFDPGEHYNSFKDGVLKLGVYPNLYPLDCENWHNQNHNDKFFELFGVQKGTMQYFEIVPEGVIDYVLAPKRQPARLFNAAEEYKQKHGLDSFQKLQETFYPKRADLEKKVDEHFKGKNFSEFSKGERLELFNLRFEYLWNVLPYDLYGYISTDIWQAKLYEILEKKIPSGKESEEFNTVLTALIQPEVPSSSFFEYLDVIDAAIKISEGTSEINNESQKLAETWGHIPVFCYGDRWGADHYSSEINDTLKEHTLPELKEKLEEGKQHKKHRAETIKKYNDQYNFTKEELQYFIDFGLVSLTKDEAEIFNGYVSHYAPALYKLMAQDLGLDEIDFKYLYIKEVNQAFTDSTFDYKSVIQKRKTVNSIEEPNEDFSEKFFVYDNESHDILNFLNQKLVTLNSSASCAYPGIVTGAIKIINSVSDIGKVNQGDIMVCQATTVDYLLGMKKAGAIVTEFGGLTCHAAVVAREFKTPCVVGMKDARSMFSEGTIVTVNASACTVTSSNDETLKKKNSVISSKLLQDLNILNKDAWVEDGRWIQPPLIWGMFTHWSQGEIVKRIAPGCDLGTIFTIDGFAYHQIKTFNELNKYLEQLYKENALKDLALKIDIEGSYILAEIMNELKASDEDIMADFESLFKKYMDFIGFWTATTIIGNQISPLAKKMGYVETEADLFEKVHPYLRESWIEEEVATMRKIAELFVKKYGETANISSSIDSDVELKNTIDAYLKKYSWARISKWIGEPIDRTYAEKRLAEEINNVIHKNYIEKIHQGSLDDSDGLVAVSVQSAYYRAQATMMEMMMAERMHSVFSVIAQKNSLEYADMLLLTPQELIQVVNDPNHEIKDKNVILERKNPFFCVIDTDGTEIILTTKDKDYSIVYDLYVNSHDSGHSNELKGIGASKGKVTALVRIISSAKEFGTFKEGEVLVTVETSPTFVPLMRMASAILTARGGITSHAAIVSRELGKPCIIAIKDVTKILNDGDLIEVDADNGVVRILKKDATDSFPINPNDYDFIGLWRDDLFAAYFWTRWFDSEKTKALGFNEITFGGTFIINGGNFFWHKEMRAGQKTILDRAITTKDGAIFGNLRTHAEKTFLRVMQETDKLAVQDPNPENFKIFIGLARELMYYWTFGASIAADVDEYIISFAQKEHIPAEDVAHYVPTPETELIRQQQDVRRLHLVLKDRGWLSRLIDDKVSVIKDIQEDVELFAQLQAHVEKYGWIEMLNYIGEPLSIDRLLSLIVDHKIQKDEIHSKQNISEDFTFVLNIAASVAYARQAGAEYSSIYSFKLLNYLNTVAKKLGITYREMLHLTPDEIITHLESGLDLRDIINRRPEGNWMVFSDKQEQTHIYDDRLMLQELGKIMIPQADASAEMFKGQIGNKGKVQGIVRVIMATDDFHKMQDGDILVTTMTTPDFVILMQKASGIITDIGGLLSHASIVSRELGKPCVIGTKFATQILRDGDLVEVDADNGIVRILKKNKITLTKEYTRDTTIIMQEAWGICCGTYIKDLLNLANPYRPGIIHYMNDGSIEIWENKQSTQWLMDAILEKNSSDPTFLPQIIENYKKQLEEIKNYWKDGYLHDLSQFPDFFEKVKQALGGFIPYYYSAVDERTPKDLREMALELRDKDEFFAINDVFIRDTLLKHYPTITGFETNVFSDEVINLPDISILKDRRNHMTLIDGVERTVETLDQLSARKPELNFISEKLEFAGQEITGQIAFKGNVTGIVRILRRRDQVDEVQIGEIIVSPMTTPDFMPAMQKAAAFVTDEGGITCHAAIVARELSKPCIIGTKFATQIFHDGDIVEVDANTGIIKLLKKNSNTKSFHKEYTRDYTYIMQEGWYDVILNKFTRYGGKQNPFVPPVLFYMNDGAIEVWENSQATPWILDTLQEKIKSDPSFIPEMLDQHERELSHMQEYWNKGFVTSVEELNEFIRLAHEYMYAFDFMYYSGVDERTPALIRERALKIRDADKYFGACDDVIRASIRAIYPELKGLENTLLVNEINNVPSRQILESRKRASLMVGHTVDIGLLSEFQTKHPEYKFNIEIPETVETKTLKGQIGNKGFGKGKVRILKRKDQIDEMQEGEILVSAMTTPEFVPAMQKAAAIITDEGGITCHAAIVARELGKPCVIGTKFATQILKDGDMVEVDADKGIVTIIK